jgi:hypothetical protein
MVGGPVVAALELLRGVGPSRHDRLPQEEQSVVAGAWMARGSS